MDGIFNSETPSFVPENDILGIGQIDKENFGLGGDRSSTSNYLGSDFYPYLEDSQSSLILNRQNEAAINPNLLLGFSEDIETNSDRDFLTGNALNDALPKVMNLLQSFAGKPDFEAEMELAFGNSYDAEKADVLKAALSGGNLGFLPEIEIVNRDLINGANGAFAGETETIYLARDFVRENLGDVGEIIPVIVEEFGHYLDWEINSFDAPGDEGEIFASFVLGEDLSLPEFLRMKAEDDGAIGFLGGKKVAIEQANVSWVGGSGDWYNPSKWSGGKVPKSSDNVTVQALDQRINISFSKGNPNIRDLFLAAKDGGSLTLNGLTTVGNDTDILAEGNQSVIKLPDLKTFSGKDVYQPSSITVKDGGQFEANKLATIKEVDLFADNSSLALPGVKSLSGRDDIVIQATNEGKLTLAAKTISGDVDITSSGEGSLVNLPGLTAFNGKDVYQPSFVFAEDEGTVRANKLKNLEVVSLYADNGKLELSGASSLSFSGKSNTEIKATNEGKLTLAAKTISGDVDITSSGEGSEINLPQLTAFNGKDVYQPSFIIAENDGTVTANKLNTLKVVSLYVDNSKLDFPEANSFSGKSNTVVKATNEGKLTLAAKTISGDVDITATGKGSEINLPQLTAFNGKDVYQPSFIFAENGGTVRANKLKNAEVVSLYADNGRLDFSGGKSFSFNGKSNTAIKATNQGKLTVGATTLSGDVDVTSSGEGSVVQLPRLTDFKAKDVYQPSFILAENGGTVKANQLKTFIGESDAVIKATNEGKLTLGVKTISGDVDITSSGEGSEINLPQLTAFNGKDVYQPSFIIAENDGTVTANKLNTLKVVSLYVDNSKLDFPEANSFSGKSNTVVKATNEGKLTLAAKTISGDVDITSSGEGSVVNLPQLTDFNGTDVYQPSFILAENDGTVRANKLKNAEVVSLYADNGRLDFSGGKSFSFNGKSNTAIKATNQGKLTVGATTLSGDVDITATGKGSVVNLPKLTRFLGKDVYQPSFILAEDGGKVKANKLITVTNVDPFVTG